MSTYRDMYRDAAQQGTGALWKRVVILRAAIEAGADKKELLRDCGQEAGDSKPQMEKYYTVAKVFNGVAIADDYDYWFYQACALAPGVDPEDVSTYEIAHKWLEFGFQGRETKRGKKTIHAKHSVDSLKRAIRAANGDGKPKPETVYKGQALITHVYPADFHGSVVWILLPNIEPEHIPTDTAIQVTITRETREPQAEAASEEPKRELIPLHTRGLAI